MAKRLSAQRKAAINRNLKKARAALAAKRAAGIIPFANEPEPTYVSQLEAALQQKDEEAKVLNGIINWLYAKL